jgi:hypothetical protein
MSLILMQTTHMTFRIGETTLMLMSSPDIHSSLNSKGEFHGRLTCGAGGSTNIWRRSGIVYFQFILSD